MYFYEYNLSFHSSSILKLQKTRRQHKRTATTKFDRILLQINATTKLDWILLPVHLSLSPLSNFDSPTPELDRHQQHPGFEALDRKLHFPSQYTVVRRQRRRVKPETSLLHLSLSLCI